MLMVPATPIITPALISSIRRQPNLPRNSWYIIAATTLSILNRSDELPRIYSLATTTGDNDNDPGPAEANNGQQQQQQQQQQHESNLSISRRMREALIKASAVGGMPKAAHHSVYMVGSDMDQWTINALMALKSVTPEHLLDVPGIESASSSRFRDMYQTPTPQVMERGETFFNKLYGKIARRVMGQMDRSGSEDLGLMARLVYGYIISNTDILTPVETSFVLIASLIPQDASHLRGALNGGASVDEVRAVRHVVIKICEASGMQQLSQDAVGGWGWRSEVANV